MSIQDGEFFALFKRMLQKIYKDPSGTPGLTSKELIRPFKRSIVISAGAQWDNLDLGRAAYIHTPDFRQIDFFPGQHPGDLSADTSKPWNSSISGFAKLYAPGEWHFKTPLIGADVEGTRTPLIVSDAALGIDGANLAAAELIGAPALAADVNLKSLGGTVQTGVNLGAKLAAYTAVTPGAPFAVTNASQSALAARAGRRHLYLLAMNMAGGCTKVTFSFATPVVSLKGYQLKGNDSWKAFDCMTGINEGAVYAITDAGTADLYAVEMT